MKNEKFLRSFRISFVIIMCIFTFILGISDAYENIRSEAYGEIRKAIEIENGKIKIFDYEINIISQKENC